MTKEDKENPKDLQFIKDHIDNAPTEARKKVEEIRKILLKEIPNPIEGLSYAMPTVRYKGKAVVCYYVWKNHIGFYPMGAMSGYEKDIADLKLSASKGAVQIPFDHKVPINFIKKVIKNRLAAIDAGKPMYNK